MSGLDEAWAAAEAALPKNWRGPVLRRSYDFPDQYWALAEEVDGDRFREGYGKTPAAALTALTDVLGPETKTAWVCDWTPTDLNPGPECPYCADRACCRLDGLGCTHNTEERHGYPAGVTP